MQAEVISQKLDGLGVLSPMCISFDAVSIGDSLFARHETFQIIIATVISLAPGHPLLTTHFMECPSTGMSHDGDSQAASVLGALKNHAAQLSVKSLRRRVLTMIAGDGAVARGGQSMRHVSTEAANKLAKFCYQTMPCLLHLCRGFLHQWGVRLCFLFWAVSFIALTEAVLQKKKFFRRPLQKQMLMPHSTSSQGFKIFQLRLIYPEIDQELVEWERFHRSEAAFRKTLHLDLH